MPTVPTLPTLPTVPAVPSVPTVPSVPSVPSVPGLPSVPGVPSVTGLTDVIPGIPGLDGLTSLLNGSPLGGLLTLIITLLTTVNNGLSLLTATVSLLQTALKALPVLPGLGQLPLPLLSGGSSGTDLLGSVADIKSVLGAVVPEFKAIISLVLNSVTTLVLGILSGIRGSNNPNCQSQSSLLALEIFKESALPGYQTCLLNLSDSWASKLGADVVAVKSSSPLSVSTTLIF